MITPRRLTAAELDSISHLIPDPEPQLAEPTSIGGAPAPARPLRVSEPLLDGNEARYVAECVAGNWISSAGPFVGRFEREFAAAVGCRHGVACSSGTAALHLALAAAGIGEGDEVLIPAFTMIATANAVRFLGADPVLVDSEPETGNLDPALLAAKLSARTKAIVPIHVYGHPAEMGAIGAFARDNGLQVIEDAAEAHGATHEGRPAGSLGEVASFSFYANKIISTGEGGMVTTDDAAIAARARELRDHAFSAERHFWHRSVAYNYRLSNLQAAVGVAQTERLDALVAARREHARRYSEGLAGIPGIGLPIERAGVRNVYWMFGVTVDDEFGISRDELRRRLAARGIETRTYFVPIHLQPAYFHRHRGERYPVAEELGRTGLYLPSGAGLTEAEIEYVVREVIRARG